MTAEQPELIRPVADEDAGNIALLDTSVAGVQALLLNRPPVNAMNAEMYRALLAAFDAIDEMPDVRCVVVGSSLDKGFCGGADRGQLAELTGPAAENEDNANWERREALATSVTERMRTLSVPTIAAVDGYAIGMGVVLASQCDMRVATPRSWFTLPELSVSRCGGGSYALRVLPQTIVRAMLFGGARLSANRAYEVGFLSDLVEPDQLWKSVMTLGQSVAAYDPYLLRTAKKALNLGERLDPTTANTVEQLYSFRLARREDA